MFGLFPWKLVKPNGPVNEPGAEWFNAVSRILSTMTVRADQTGSKCYINRPNTDGSFWEIVFPIRTLDAGVGEQLFRVTRVDDTHVEVHGGSWLRWWGSSYSKASLTVDGGGTSGLYSGTKTLTVSSTGYVILTMSAEINATTLEASFSTTYPTTNESNVVRVIARVPVVDGVVGVPEQFHLGDIYTAWNLTYAAASGETPSAQKGTTKMIQGSLTLTVAESGDTISGEVMFPQFTVADGQLVIQGVVATPISLTLTNVAYSEASNEATHAVRADTSGTVDTIAGHDHGVLDGLGDDDHSQYPLIDGTAVRNVGDLVMSGSMQAGADGFYCATHAGVTSPKKLRIPCDDGTFVEGYLRGGIICVD